ncbi:MAG: hypothetical protein EOM15_05305 [Spirochaetia bacterium]|nr:hypothetical protein [Spirochaetia bacterium]
MKQLLRLLVLCVGSFLLVSCSFLGNVPASYSPNLVDDEQRMLEEGDSFFYKNRNVEVVENQVVLTFKRFSGLETVCTLACEEPQEIGISINAAVNTNLYKLVLINDDREEVTTLSQGSVTNSQTLTLQSGRNRIKVVGYDVDGSVQIALTVGQAVVLDLCGE